MSCASTSASPVSPHPWPAFPKGRPLLGANGTEALQALLAAGETVPVDYLKVGPFQGEAEIVRLSAGYPLMLHLDDTLSGAGPLPPETVARLQRWVALTGTPWTSEHIGFSVAQADLDSALITQAASDLLSRQETFAHITANARALAAELPVPLLLENIPLFPNLAHMHVCEPDFVAAALEAAGCDLLLDLAHARVAADVLRWDVHDYLAALPLDRVVEIHLSGPRSLHELDARRAALVRENAHSVAHIVAFGDANLVDAHEALREADYALLEWALGRCAPRAVSLEYFRDPAALREQLRRLAAIIGAKGGQSA